MSLPSPLLQVSPPDLIPELQRLFGFSGFREGQEEIVRRAVEGRDTLALMPTGAGKSLCYQLAAMLRPSPTLVISPLIALMKDQIDNLPPEVRDHASLINSSLDPGEAALRLQRVASGQYKLLYAAPERLRQRQFIAALRSVGVGLIVIDEVHCVSMWGHDFRPDYLFIRSALAALGEPSVLGLTATATPATERDISASLGRELEVVRASVVRPNLRYEVEQVENEEARLRRTLARAKGLSGSGIIYARSREKCEQLAQLLQRNSVHALHYHAGLDSQDRTRVQESFLGGKARVIVATTAFGMGIDKPDIRWVVLYNFPNSLESYVQMVGRAGRDGQESTCVLLASGADASNLRRFARADVPKVEDLRAVYRQLQLRSEDGWTEATPDELREDAGLPENSDPRVLVGMLERAGLVRREYDAGRAMCVDLLPPPPDASRRITELLSSYDKQALERAERMIRLADSQSCRHAQVAEHFGERVSVPCGMCDVCLSGGPLETATGETARPLPDDIAGTIVRAVAGLRWPLGQKGLVAMLRGSVAAPPSAQGNPAFGALAAAKDGTVKRWIGTLLERGCLEAFESEDGYRLLRVGDDTVLPRLTAAPASSARRERTTRNSAQGAEHVGDSLADEDAELFERLRAWRYAKAQEKKLPPYVILHDRVLRELAAVRPGDSGALLDINGLGPSKVEQYGEEILGVLENASGGS